MSKEIALIFHFDEAPQALQRAADIHAKNVMRHAKAQKEFRAISAELEVAKENLNMSQKVFDAELKAWDISDLKSANKEPKE